MKQAVQSIIQKINADADVHGNERYEQIKREIDEEIAEENAQYSDEQKKRREALIKNNALEFTRLAERIASRRHNDLLTYQNELLDGMFNRALAKLKNITEAELMDMFYNTIKNLSGVFELIPGGLSRDKFDAQKIKEAAGRIQNLSVMLSENTIPLKSGFVLRNEIIEYNCLFEDLIEEEKQEQAAKILKEVFGN